MFLLNSLIKFSDFAEKTENILPKKKSALLKGEAESDFPIN